MEPHLLEDCKKWKIPGTDWIIQGFSQAGNKTGFAIFSLKLLFDAGLPTHKLPKMVLLTHSHSDHSFNIPCIAMGHKQRCPVYCPNEMEGPLKLMCRASQSLNDCTPLTGINQVNTFGVKPGDCIDLNNIKINVIKCYHNVPSVGFELSILKRSLKRKYIGLKGKELKKLKETGIDIIEKKYIKKFTFLGDTTIEVFNKDVLSSPVIMVECTILDNEVSPEETANRGHIHWDQLKPIVESYPNTLFVLIHLSKRYSNEYIESFFNNTYNNIYVWV